MAEEAVSKSTMDSLIEAFDNQELCDVKFSVKDKIIGSHKLILSGHCRFLYDLAADWTTEKDPICIDGIEFDAFNEFLRCCIFYYIHFFYVLPIFFPVNHKNGPSF